MLRSMQISDEALDDFILAYKQDFGRQLNREEAREVVFRITKLYELLANTANAATPKQMPTAGANLRLQL